MFEFIFQTNHASLSQRAKAKFKVFIESRNMLYYTTIEFHTQYPFREALNINYTVISLNIS